MGVINSNPTPMGKHKWTAWKERKCFETSEDYFHKSINAWHPFHLPGKEQFLRQNGWLSKHPLFSFTKCVLNFCLKNVFCQIKERVQHQCYKKCNERSTMKDKNPFSKHEYVMKSTNVLRRFWQFVTFFRRLQKKKKRKKERKRSEGDFFFVFFALLADL